MLLACSNVSGFDERNNATNQPRSSKGDTKKTEKERETEKERTERESDKEN